MTDAILLKLAERGTEAAIIGIILLILAPMLFKLVDKMLHGMREEARLERTAAREESSAARSAFAVEMKAERQAHREETKQLAEAMRGLELATHDQTLAVTRELRYQTGVLEKIQESGDVPRVRLEVDHTILEDERRDPTPTPFPILEPEEEKTNP
jgi:hypothetical protein